MKSDTSEFVRQTAHEHETGDIDQGETAEWLEALEDVARVSGVGRVSFLL